MVVDRKGNSIIITLTDEEVKTVEYIESVSSMFLTSYLNQFLESRKSQHIDSLKQEILKDTTRDELLTALEVGSIEIKGKK